MDMTLAQATVTSLAAAEPWYRRIFGAPPNSRPMDGLIEWRLGHAHGVQVFETAERAGQATVVVGATDLDATLTRLHENGIEHGGAQPGGGGRLVVLDDPDGNQVVIVDAEAAHGQAASEITHATLRFQRHIDGPIERVWTAYADVDKRRRWSVPDGEAVEYDDDDFTPGGVDHYRCGPLDDLSNHLTTRYVRIDAPNFFVATNELHRNGEPVAIDTTHWRLDADGGSTTLTVVVQVTSLVGDHVLDGYEAGHEATLDQLAEFSTDG